jgi:hypothetical protein
MQISIFQNVNFFILNHKGSKGTKEYKQKKKAITYFSFLNLVFPNFVPLKISVFRRSSCSASGNVIKSAH